MQKAKFITLSAAIILTPLYVLAGWGENYFEVYLFGLFPDIYIHREGATISLFFMPFVILKLYERYFLNR